MKLCASIELTNACNFSCGICPRAHKEYTRKTGFISEKLFERAADQCNKYARTVEIGFFGEQLLHPSYDIFFEKLIKRKFELHVNTNLSLVTKKTFDTWMTAQVNQVRLSLDASNSKVFDLCRPGPVKDLNGVETKNRFAAVTEKVIRWLEIRNHCPTRLVFVASSYNSGDENNFVHAWQRYLGPYDHILVKNVVSYGGAVNNEKISRGVCNIWNIGYVVISHTGEVTPCNLDVNIHLNSGNIKEKNLNEIYENAKKMWGQKTGCGREIKPCNKCVDSNNWSNNKSYRKKKCLNP
jgi:radical SAM protein with 4Fe4S-binding SPASM domain